MNNAMLFMPHIPKGLRYFPNTLYSHYACSNKDARILNANLCGFKFGWLVKPKIFTPNK